MNNNPALASRIRLLACCSILVAVHAYAQSAATRYHDLVRVIDRNTGYAHMTRGVNMFTLYALRTCVTANDVPVLNRMLTDKDPIVRRAAASVLADLGPEGMTRLRERLQAATKIEDRMLLEEVISEPDRPPILSYPLINSDRRRLRGCKPEAGR